MKKLLAIVGPTGSGKSELAMSLAKSLHGEIVSADSRQIYKFLDIGTSKPSKKDQNEIPHHFIDLLDPTEYYSAGTFGHDAQKTIENIVLRNKQPVLVGGSGLYVRAVIDGFFDGPGKDPEIRNQLETRLSEEGPTKLLEILQRVDPASAAVMEITKPRRIVRALEVYYITGTPLSLFHKEQPSERHFETLQFGIEWNRMQLYARINKRVDIMLSRGLIEEVKSLQRRGYNYSLNALNSVGYKEVYAYLEGKLSYDDMVALMKRNTRRFAKRQLTWFRADRRIEWIRMDESSSFEVVAFNVRRSFELS